MRCLTNVWQFSNTTYRVIFLDLLNYNNPALLVIFRWALIDSRSFFYSVGETEEKDGKQNELDAEDKTEKPAPLKVSMLKQKQKRWHKFEKRSTLYLKDRST